MNLWKTWIHNSLSIFFCQLVREDFEQQCFRKLIKYSTCKFKLVYTSVKCKIFHAEHHILFLNCHSIFFCLFHCLNDLIYLWLLFAKQGAKVRRYCAKLRGSIQSLYLYICDLFITIGNAFLYCPRTVWRRRPFYLETRFSAPTHSLMHKTNLFGNAFLPNPLFVTLKWNPELNFWYVNSIRRLEQLFFFEILSRSRFEHLFWSYQALAETTGKWVLPTASFNTLYCENSVMINWNSPSVIWSSAKLWKAVCQQCRI